MGASLGNAAVRMSILPGNGPTKTTLPLRAVQHTRSMLFFQGLIHFPIFLLFGNHIFQKDDSAVTGYTGFPAGPASDVLVPCWFLLVP